MISNFYHPFKTILPQNRGKYRRHIFSMGQHPCLCSTSACRQLSKNGIKSKANPTDNCIYCMNRNFTDNKIRLFLFFKKFTEISFHLWLVSICDIIADLIYCTRT